MNTLRYIFVYLRKDMIQDLSYRTGFMMRFFGILITCLLYFYLAKIVDTADSHYRESFGGSYFPYFILGMGVYRFTQHGLHHFVRRLNSEAVNGTLEALWLGRLKPFALIFSMAVGPFLNALLGLIGLILIGSLISPEVIQKISFPALSIAVFLSFFVYLLIGLLVIGVTFVTKRGQGMVNLFGAVNLILAGVVFPHELLPSWLQTASVALPLTHIIQLARFGVGGIGREFMFECLYFLGFIILICPLALVCLKRAVTRVEIEGSLAHY